MKIILSGLLVAALITLASPVLSYGGWAGFQIVHAQHNADEGTTISYYFPLVGNRIWASAQRSASAIEVTQAVQDDGNGVDLVAGRTTVARVYLEDCFLAVSMGCDSAVVKLYGQRDGVNLPQSPIGSEPHALTVAANRSDYHSSINFILPPEWTAGGTLTLTAVVGEDALSISIDFVTVPAMNIVIVPVQYTNAYTGQVYPLPTDDDISQEVYRLFPVEDVNVRYHSPIMFSGDLANDSNDWSALLFLVTTLKYYEVAEESVHPSTLYYGLVADSNGVENLWNGIAGMGWVGERVAIGLDITNPYILQTTGQIAAHEFGHNLGRQHAPCGNPAHTDPLYPYSNGSIGQVGLDVLRATVWNPEPYERGANPFGAYDIMSYCYPLWVSDYTYEGLLQDQLRWGGEWDMQAGMAQGAERGALLVQALPAADGLKLAPLQYVHGSVTPPAPDGDYLIELLDAAGQVVLSYAVQGMVSETPHAVGQSPAPDARPVEAVYALVPLPEAPVAKVRLVARESGLVLAEQGVMLER